MNCWECEEQIAVAARGGNDSARMTDAAAEHLAECDACGAFAAQMGDLTSILTRCKAPLPERPAPAAAREAIVARLAAARRQPSRRAAGRLMAALDLPDLLSPYGRVLPGAAGVALLLAYVGLGLAGWTHRSATEHRGASAAGTLPPNPNVPKTQAPAARPGEEPDRRVAASNSGIPSTATASPGRRAAALSPDRGRILAEAPRLLPVSRHDDPMPLNGVRMRSTSPTASTHAEPWKTIEAQVLRSVTVQDDFVRIPFPQIAAAADRQVAEAVDSYKREAAVVDARLAHEVAVQQKATALSDLCEHLRGETGIQLSAGQSVADEKVTLFCRAMPLRDVMRQLSRPFGYTWLRSGKAGEYKYELVQDLRSQLLEEELRNRDRNDALLALDREMERFRPYLSLTPDEALARSKTAPPAEKRLLEKLAGYGWGAIQMYFRLSPQDMAAMRAGQEPNFSDRPGPNDRPLSAEVKRGVLQSFRDWTVVKYADGYRMAFEVANPDTPPIPVPALPGTHAWVSLSIDQRVLGRTTLHGYVGWGMDNGPGQHNAGGGSSDDCATGISPAVLKPDNAAVNAKLAREPALRTRVSLRPRPSCTLPPDPNAAAPGPPEPRVTTADVLEVLHQATGMPIVSDYYTRLYKPEEVSAQNGVLFDALSHVADAMRMRWNKDGSWLQLRSTSYYDDRRKEVPNRLLTRWAAARRQQGMLTVDDLVEIAQLPDAQLDAREMAEGVKALFGLIEWDLGRNSQLRPHLRFLAGLTPEQRREAMAPAGLAFTRMPLAQQQRFITLALGSSGEGLQSLEELAGSALRVEYTHPGGFQWGEAGHPGQGHYTRWVVPLEAGPQGRRVLRPVVQERTREGALEAVRRVDPQVRTALLEAARRADPRLDASPYTVEEAQIFPTRLDLCFIYMPGATNARGIQLQTSFASYGIQP